MISFRQYLEEGKSGNEAVAKKIRRIASKNGYDIHKNLTAKTGSIYIILVHSTSSQPPVSIRISGHKATTSGHVPDNITIITRRDPKIDYDKVEKAIKNGTKGIIFQ